MMMYPIVSSLIEVYPVPLPHITRCSDPVKIINLSHCLCRENWPNLAYYMTMTLLQLFPKLVCIIELVTVPLVNFGVFVTGSNIAVLNIIIRFPSLTTGSNDSIKCLYRVIRMESFREVMLTIQYRLDSELITCTSLTLLNE